MHLYVNIREPKVYCNIYSTSALAVFIYFSKRVFSDEGACTKKCTNTVPLMCSIMVYRQLQSIAIKVLFTFSVVPTLGSGTAAGILFKLWVFPLSLFQSSVSMPIFTSPSTRWNKKFWINTLHLTQYTMKQKVLDQHFHLTHKMLL